MQWSVACCHLQLFDAVGWGGCQRTRVVVVSSSRSTYAAGEPKDGSDPLGGRCMDAYADHTTRDGLDEANSMQSELHTLNTPVIPTACYQIGRAHV